MRHGWGLTQVLVQAQGDFPVGTAILVGTAPEGTLRLGNP